jgi:hypothetical protein
MDTLVIALGPAFAAGFALQRLLEILDPLLDKIQWVKGNKKIVLGLVSLVVGLILSLGIGLRVLRPLGVEGADLVDIAVTALIVSAGTEGFNSILKFLGYTKENTKTIAAQGRFQNTPDALDEIQRMV